MPKPTMKPELERLAHDIIETLIAGHKEWRPDLSYPESHSDMMGAVQGLLRVYEVKRRPIPYQIFPTQDDIDRQIRDAKNFLQEHGEAMIPQPNHRPIVL